MKDFIASLSNNKEVEIIQECMSTSRYLDILLDSDNPYFKGMVCRIYPRELQLNKANSSDTEAPFFGFTYINFKRTCFIQIFW